MPLTNDVHPGQEGDLNRGRDLTPILVGETLVATDYHVFMMKASKDPAPAQAPLFPLPKPKKQESSTPPPPKTSPWRSRVNRTHNGRPSPGITPVVEKKPA